MKKQYVYSPRDLMGLFEAARHQIDSLKNHPSGFLLFKPAPDAWSPLDISRHLLLFGNTYMEQIFKAVSKFDKLPKAEGPFKPRWHFRKMAASFEPPYKLKSRTISLFTPDPEDERDIAEVLESLADLQNDVLNLLQRADAGKWDLKRIKGVNPALKFLTMTLAEYFVLMEVHQRRHFWQIEQLMKQYSRSVDSSDL